MTGAVYGRTSNLGLGLLEFNFPNWGDDANENMRLLDISVGAAGVQISGIWKNSTDYTSGQLVADDVDDTLFRCLVSHTSTAAPITFAGDRFANPTYWLEMSTVLHSRGQWQSATVYYINDVVYRDANKYSWALATRQFTSSTTYDDDVATGALVIITDTTNTVNTATGAATAASNSATAAAGSASSASTSATNAANSATAANTSKNAAATSASGASTSASTASTAATNASNSATAANNSAISAQSSEDDAEAAQAAAQAALAAMLPDAPADSKTYGRRNHIWQQVADTSLPEAPFDSKTYGRYNGTWLDITSGISLDWTSITGKPSTFPPTLPIAQSGITNLVSDLALKAPLASPTFTGDPKAPTPTAGDNDTSIATTAFVSGAIATSDSAQGTALALKADLANPVFTGDPQAPTPLGGDNDTSIATTAFVQQAITSGGAPAGAVQAFARNTAPTGWLKANGALVNRVTYAALFTAIGTTFGVGDGSTTFGLPDLRGEFLRYWDDARGIDTGRAFGTGQVDGVASHVHALSATSGVNSVDHSHSVSITSGINSVSHTHTFSDSSSATGTGSANHSHTTNVVASTGAGSLRGAALAAGTEITTDASGAAHTHTVAVSGTTAGVSANHTHLVSGASAVSGVTHTHAVSGTTDNNTGGLAETRPRNVALLACIKY